jgi:acylphosphatase
MPTYHLIIKGKVQGVFYRATAKKIADELGVTGWVKNTADDNVEAVVSGTEEQINKFIAWCKKGPAKAKVTDMIATPQPETQFKDFSVIR